MRRMVRECGTAFPLPADVWHDSFVCVVWHDSFMRDVRQRLIRRVLRKRGTASPLPSDVWHGSFVCVVWMSCYSYVMCDITRLLFLMSRHTHWWVMSHIWRSTWCATLLAYYTHFSWWVLQHCTGFARLVWGRLRVHRAFVYSDWFVCCVMCDLTRSLFHSSPSLLLLRDPYVATHTATHTATHNTRDVQLDSLTGTDAQVARCYHCLLMCVTWPILRHCVSMACWCVARFIRLYCVARLIHMWCVTMTDRIVSRKRGTSFPLPSDVWHASFVCVAWHDSVGSLKL